MDGSAFDRLVRHVGGESSRRGLLRSAFVATVAGLGVASVLILDDAAAKSCKAKCENKPNRHKRAQCKKKCNQNNERCFSENKPCTSDGQCCDKAHLVCDVPFGAGNSDKKCCRGQGATCSTSPEGPHCCTGEAGIREFDCVSGVCQQCLGAACPP